MPTRQFSLLTELKLQQPKSKAIYVSTYIPRECGIATFAKDLTNAINILNPSYLADIVAIDDLTEKSDLPKRDYPWEVKYKIKQEDLKSWIDAADYINESGAEVVCLQHEFGIYGGDRGDYIIPFMERLKKPVVVTMHTVLPDPDPQYLAVAKKIISLASAVVVMLDSAVTKLVDIYGADPEKVAVIPHGVPDIAFSPTDWPKRKLGLGKSNIIMGFGLINTGKGYEYAIEAMPAIIAKHPNTKLLILGETHPVVVRTDGQAYRHKLESLVTKLHLEKNVIFINRYLTLGEIIDYLKATDIYITPFLNLDQITSGTLSYALGAGRACVSTPYLYAQDVLKDGRGILVPPKDSAALADAITDLFDHPDKRLDMAKNAYAFGRRMIWPRVALQYLDLYDIIKQRAGQNVSA